MALSEPTVATWRFTPPPRALLGPSVEPVKMHIHTPAVMAEITLAPGRTGPMSATLSLMSGDLGALGPKDVTVTLANSAAGIEPMERKAVKMPDGQWRAEGLVLPVAGRWQVRVDVLISDFEKAALEGTVQIPP